MIASIVLTGCHILKTDSNNKIRIANKDENAKNIVLNIDKEVPFIRYRFDHYGETEIAYIEETLKRFNMPTHLVELELNEDTPVILDRLDNLKVAKFVYINITDEDVSNCCISGYYKSILHRIDSNKMDRLMFKDKSTTLDMVSFNKMERDLMREMGYEEDFIGICSSPLSFTGKACLTAVKAREIISKYTLNWDVPIPTANHQSMNTCGCIRYIVIDSDTLDVGKAKPVEKEKEKEGKQNKTGRQSKKVNKKSSMIKLPTL